MGRKSPAPKDIALLRQLHRNNQLELAPEFQRNAVWPSAAKAYLIDTILNEKPIPVLFFQKQTNTQSGLVSYVVIDGQQRLRAIFDFLDDKFPLTQSSPKASYYKKRFSQLSPKDKETIFSYDLNIEDLHGYSDEDIRDMFARMNRFVVKLSRQELRNAMNSGAFHKFASRVAEWDFWRQARVFSDKQLQRMRAIEYAAELAILLIEGPQDKKKALDLYYEKYAESFPDGKKVEKELRTYLEWIRHALPDIADTRFRSPVDLYGLIGALKELTSDGKKIERYKPRKARGALHRFDERVKGENLGGEYARYLVAASSQTDNLIPRKTRIEMLLSLLKKI